MTAVLLWWYKILMEYQEIIHIIENKRRFGNLPGVIISKHMLAAVGNPQKDLAFIHIAGTNGKGSTAAFLYAILNEAGIKAGLFTSPHLIDFTERIQANGRQISKEDAARLGQKLLHLDLNVNPVMFDYCMAMAMLYFKEQGCQIVILETGLGGRLDSTNAIDAPKVSVITKIGYDHTDILGNTLSEIAAEKAGILKKGTRAILESQHPEALHVLESHCKNLQIPYQITDPKQIVPVDSGFSYPGELPYQMKMSGEFQKENALAAILSARELMALSYPVTEHAIHRGIANAFWAGRMETICRNPFLLIDGAHNKDGVESLLKSLRILYPGEKFHFIMGALADKDYRGMAELILPFAQKVTAVTPENKRALQAKTLAAYIRKAGIKASCEENLAEVFAPFFTKQPETNSDLRTVAFGSLYFIGEIKKIFS